MRTPQHKGERSNHHDRNNDIETANRKPNTDDDGDAAELPQATSRKPPESRRRGSKRERARDSASVMGWSIARVHHFAHFSSGEYGCPERDRTLYDWWAVRDSDSRP